jgi:N-acetylglucosaminyldiphosphoundecaprenol N-acetyl-beta-D-mannosaminyltransferase
MSNAVGNRVLGVPIWPNGLDHLVGASLHAIEVRRHHPGHPYVFACANPHSLAVADRDAEFRSALQQADAVVADGAGLTAVARLCGRDVGPRITGSDYFSGLMRALDVRGGRVAFFGSKLEVLDLLVARCRREFPRVTIATAISPPFGEWTASRDAEFLEQIRAADVDVLWVGMTAPKQEKWVQRHVATLPARLVGSIGAVFDYYAGTVQRAPDWICNAGLEWAYRFAREPARLWQRNVISGPRFVGLAVAEALGLRSYR